MQKVATVLLIGILLGSCKRQEEVRYIPSGSMQPTLQVNDRVFVDNTLNPKPGNIITLSSPHGFDEVMKSQYSRRFCPLTEIPVIGKLFADIMKNPACDVFIQRIVASSGDQVEVDSKGKVMVNGEALKETYISNYCQVDDNGVGPCSTIKATVPEGYVLTLGDNRANSWDGRFWPGGPFLPKSEIRGVVTQIWYPLERAKSLQ